jgi:DNA-binding MarR family transcriptional regulator
MPVELDCYCSSLRQTTRLLTQVYDSALRPAGLTTGQFTLLRVLTQAPAARVGELADLLGIEQSAMTRTLAVMHRSGWIEKDRSASSRETRYVLTREGRACLDRCLPLWKSAQKRVVQLLGKHEADEFRELAFALTRKLHSEVQ